MRLDPLEHQLNILLTHIKDSEKVYKKATEETEEEDLEQFFEHNYKKRNEFKNELVEMIHELNGEAETDQSFAGIAHRVWLDIKEVFIQDNDRVILEECLEGEQATREDYEDAVQHAGIDTSQKRILSDHLKEIKMSEDQIKKMIEQRT